MFFWPAIGDDGFSMDNRKGKRWSAMVTKSSKGFLLGKMNFRQLDKQSPIWSMGYTTTHIYFIQQ